MTAEKEFFELGKKIFDRLNPPGTPPFKPYFSKRKWVGLTDDEFDAIDPKLSLFQFYKAIEYKLKEKNHG